MSADRGGDAFLARVQREREPDVKALEQERSFTPPPAVRGFVARTPPLKPRSAPGRYAPDHEQLATWAATHGWDDELAALRLDGHAHIIIEHTSPSCVTTLCGEQGSAVTANTGVAPCGRCASFRR